MIQDETILSDFHGICPGLHVFKMTRRSSSTESWPLGILVGGGLAAVSLGVWVLWKDEAREGHKGLGRFGSSRRNRETGQHPLEHSIFAMCELLAGGSGGIIHFRLPVWPAQRT